jgi:hypothetical protein
MNNSTICKFVFAIILTCIPCSIIKAMFDIPSEVPVDRLIANATAYVEENPTDANGYYVLGRIHYLAFSLKALKINATVKGENLLPKIAENWQFELVKGLGAHKLTSKELGYSRVPGMNEDAKKKYDELYQKKKKEIDLQGWDSMGLMSSLRNITNHIPSPDPNQLIQHAADAMKNFRKAIDMAPKNGLYYLGYASLLEQYVNYLKERDIKEIPEEFRNIILEKAKDFYYQAYILSIEDDLQSKIILAWAIN